MDTVLEVYCDLNKLTITKMIKKCHYYFTITAQCHDVK